MKLRVLALILAAGLAAAFTAQAQPVTKDFPVVQGKTYKFQRIAEGVYYATGGFGSNNVVVINDSDVLLVDTGTSPANARKFLADVHMLTNKPVRYVVNTHWHFDHTDGNSIFAPSVKIIGHEYLYDMLAHTDVLHKEPYLSSQGTAVPAQIADLRKQISDERDAAKKADLNQQLAKAVDVERQLKEIRPTAPNVSYSNKMVIHSGGREIDLLFLGRGHTGGDTVVYLPKEKIVCSGDLMESQVAYMGDAFFDEWITTLDELKKLDWDVDLPGHGVPFTNKQLVTDFQSVIKEITTQAAALRAQGVSADDAAKRIDLTVYAKDFPNIRGVGMEVRGARRVYAWMDEKGQR